MPCRQRMMSTVHSRLAKLSAAIVALGTISDPIAVHGLSMSTSTSTTVPPPAHPRPSCHQLPRNTVADADRRSVLRGAAAAAALSVLGPTTALLSSPRPARGTVDIVGAATRDLPPSLLTVPRTKSVVVLGANGGTGRECVTALLASGRTCVATTRSGTLNDPPPPDVGKNLRVAPADVTSPDSLVSVLRGGGRGDVGAVIFAASASASGGDAAAVDRDGVVNAARCCIENDIARLVVVSSGTVTRPDSAVYQLLNVVGKGIMKAKIQGEDALRDLYADPEALRRGLGYTVVRPGGLTTGPPLGPASLELNQGDTKSGRLSRADVAGICVACLDSPDAFDSTFECYGAETAKPVESVGLSNLMKSTDPTAFKSGRERRGNTWEDLFHGLERDPGHHIVVAA